MSNGILYRFKQFWWGIRAKPLTTEQMTHIRTILSAEQFTLYQKYSINDQQHGYRVLQHLQQAGYKDPELLTAGLLHDVGKSKSDMTVIDRSIVVLGRILVKKQTEIWGQHPLEQASWWQRPFVIREQHPAWGADMAQEIGCTPQVLRLIYHHQDDLETAGFNDPHFETLLAQLQWADDLS